MGKEMNRISPSLPFNFNLIFYFSLSAGMAESTHSHGRTIYAPPRMAHRSRGLLPGQFTQKTLQNSRGLYDPDICLFDCLHKILLL